MPDITHIVVPGGPVDIDKIYRDGVYGPAFSADTFEALNGGLTQANWQNHNGTGDDGQITPYMVQSGTFARGWYHGFDRTEFVYGFQTGGDKKGGFEDKRVIHAGLSASLFIGFRPSVVLFGFQAWFQHDATYWNDGLTEEWTWKLEISSRNAPEGVSNSVFKDVGNAMGGRLPWGRYNTTTDLMPEDMWRYVHKQSSIPSTAHQFDNDYLELKLTLAGLLSSDKDQGNAKLKTITGGIWVLALR